MDFSCWYHSWHALSWSKREYNDIIGKKKQNSNFSEKGVFVFNVAQCTYTSIDLPFKAGNALLQNFDKRSSKIMEP